MFLYVIGLHLSLIWTFSGLEVTKDDYDDYGLSGVWVQVVEVMGVGNKLSDVYIPRCPS